MIVEPRVAEREREQYRGVFQSDPSVSLAAIGFDERLYEPCMAPSQFVLESA
jgi:hypothetical protein